MLVFFKFEEISRTSEGAQKMTPTAVHARKGFVRRGHILFILLPLRLCAFFSTFGLLWVESVVHILLCFLLNVRLGPRATAHAAEEAGTSSRVAFVNDWLKLRIDDEYPTWFVKFHDTHLRVAQFAAKVVLFCLGYSNLVVKGERDPRADVIVCNHRGIIDALVLSFALNQVPIFVGGVPIIELPFIREIGISLDVYFVDESMRKFAVRELRDILSKSSSHRPLVMFPEGSADYGTSLRTWIHPGCFQIVSAERMQAVALTFQGLGEFSPTWPLSSKLHILFGILFHLAQIPSNRSRVEFIKPKVAQNATREEMMEDFRRAIANSLDVPVANAHGGYDMPHRAR